jgi:hypothetical protein
MTYEEARALIRGHTDYGGSVDVHMLATAIATSLSYEPVAKHQTDAEALGEAWQATIAYMNGPSSAPATPSDKQEAVAYLRVPVEPTQEMIDAGCDCEPVTRWNSNGEILRERYKAMLKAAPLALFAEQDRDWAYEFGKAALDYRMATMAHAPKALQILMTLAKGASK